ncbi:mitochondrial ribosomal protein S18C (predicted), isoform CRA_a [Rattus norvegicus]|uniref:Small ribosomal subunit protein bS18m n=3 Tax=Rattus norvegicus TaxID=10116 RepID=A6K5X9_RAT|nr:28S ribosomal protein S18c, mitochondrial [Rattus norvegicus]EDL99549.1 mitochondrial ribosomal protein S18C (predicted), isoform CRA_a [Rattus norvegicus]|eukprot:NP_001099466.1 28S ribosomal protein S18c, mitochondrial [Rattus norvegicus]
MAGLLALRSCIGRKNLTTATGCFTDRATHAVSVPWRRCFSQYEQVTSNEDLPIPMENPYKEPLKKCVLCEKRVDYKNVQLLSQFISPFTGCIYGRHITGLCGKKQKEVTKAIKRAQKMGFMPVTYKDPAYLKDPKVCNIRYRE